MKLALFYNKKIIQKEKIYSHKNTDFSVLFNDALLFYALYTFEEVPSIS